MVRLKTLVLLFALSAASSLAVDRPSPAPSKEIRLLFPGGAFPQGFEREFKTIIAEWNARAPVTSRVRLIRAAQAGEEASTARVLMARKLAGDAPDIALVDPAEVQALTGANAIVSLPAGQSSLGFVRTLPVIVANLALVPRGTAPFKMPATTDELKALLDAPTGTSPRMAIPMRGTRALWLFESLAGLPLWKRETGGLQSNRDLSGAVAQLQRWIDTDKLRAGQSWEQATQAFLDQKVPYLVTSIDTLKLLQTQAPFSWDAALLPSLNPARGPIPTGSDLVVTHRSDGVDAFLNYLYTPAVAQRLTEAGGYLPAKAGDAAKSDKLPEAFRRLASAWTARQSKAPAAIPTRSTDIQVVQARTEWIKALTLLLAHSPRPLELPAILSQIDTRMGGIE